MQGFLRPRLETSTLSPLPPSLGQSKLHEVRKGSWLYNVTDAINLCSKLTKQMKALHERNYHIVSIKSRSEQTEKHSIFLDEKM